MWMLTMHSQPKEAVVMVAVDEEEANDGDLGHPNVTAVEPLAI